VHNKDSQNRRQRRGHHDCGIHRRVKRRRVSLRAFIRVPSPTPDCSHAGTGRSEDEATAYMAWRRRRADHTRHKRLCAASLLKFFANGGINSNRLKVGSSRFGTRAGSRSNKIAFSVLSMCFSLCVISIQFKCL
jgi:hypothetical protein